jgi:hypothetical protein
MTCRWWTPTTWKQCKFGGRGAGKTAVAGPRRPSARMDCLVRGAACSPTYQLPTHFCATQPNPTHHPCRPPPCSQKVMASMDERQYERFAAFNSARLTNRPLKKVGARGRLPRRAARRRRGGRRPFGASRARSRPSPPPQPANRRPLRPVRFRSW